jgi:UDP-glucose 4-epimerase
MAKILVTGGCGYIGSHTLIDLIAHGYEVVSIDNLSRTYAATLDRIAEIAGIPVTNYAIDLCDREAVWQVFQKEKNITGVIHFAALKSVSESVAEPLLYFRNNLQSLINILDATVAFGVDSFVFSSSCSVYGNATELPVTELTPFMEAESPYARTKQMGEQMIQDLARVAKGKYVILRYFNPVGAHTSGLNGENPKDGHVLNIFPRVMGTATGKYDVFQIMGDDYDTRDGTCIRDYIHVMDIAAAHTQAIKYASTQMTDNCEIFNLGTGDGVSVLEVVQAFERVTGLKLNYQMSPRRAGDVVAIYANNDKAIHKLGWRTQYSLDEMIRTAWMWEHRDQ